ncbi:MAG: hypothetical protein Q9216_003576 [Gyalolechia sp. 2 TL-2023]
MYSSQSTSLVVVAVVLVLLATVAVALRFKVRGNVKTGRGPDDWIILGALVNSLWSERALDQVFQYATSSLTIYGATVGGHGDTLDNLSRNPEEGKRWARVCVWCRVTNRGQFFSCKPISDSWTFFQDRTGHCPVGIPDFQLALAAINMSFDLVIVCMPLFVISRLQMDRKRKWAVGGIFMLGAL